MNIRGKSVGEELEVNVICPDDGETEVPVTINLDDIEVQKNPDHTNRIKLDDHIMMEMKYPSLDQFIKNNFDFDNKNAMDQSFDLILKPLHELSERFWSASMNCRRGSVSLHEQSERFWSAPMNCRRGSGAPP